MNEDQHFNGLTPAEAERLSLVVEEMSEAIQIIEKIRRNGYENYHPDDDMRTTSRCLLEKELGHVFYAVDLMIQRNDVRAGTIQGHTHQKDKTIQKYLHHNEPIRYGVNQ